MSDYIKREDAVNAFRLWVLATHGHRYTNKECAPVFASIPPADVVPKDFHDKTCEAMAKRHTEEIQKFMWIPCSERLPREYSDGERVLATTDVDGLGVIIMPIYDVKSWYRKGYISAWVPLPKPYEEREGE